MTADSFTSASLDPPLVLVSVGRRAWTAHLLAARGGCAVSVLTEEQRGWGDRVAGRHGDGNGTFADGPHHLTEDGLPIFAGALASVVCRAVAVRRAGDHRLVVGEVEPFAASPGGRPLVFFGGGYPVLATHGPRS